MMKSLFAVSVIVPVYNGEKYIRRCLDSLLNQTLENIQIIVVNDASTDNTLSILNEFKKQAENKVTIITLPINKKQGGARNAGLDVARGEYIGFVDADDFVKLDMYKKLYEKALSHNYDVVDSDYLIHDGERVIRSEVSANLTAKKDIFNNYGRLWTKIFKNHFFNKNDGSAFLKVCFMKITIYNSFWPQKQKIWVKLLKLFTITRTIQFLQQD